MAHTVAAAHQKTAKGDPQKQRPPFMDLIRLVLYHSRIANAHIHGFRIANHERSKDMQKYQKDIKSDKQYSRLILKEGACR